MRARRKTRSQAGFRTDFGSGRDELTVQGDAYRGSMDQPLPGQITISGVALALDTISISGANLNGRWRRELEGGSSITVQAYYDRTERTVPPTFGQDLDVFDVQFQHSLRPLGAHSITWGAQYRHAADRAQNSAIIAFLPADVNQKWLSVFAQDEITLREDLRLTVGARIERNDYTGHEFLPTARIAWNVTPDHLLWAAATRTVRAPARLDRDTFVPGAPPFLLRGGPQVRFEVAKVYEAGYRGRPLQNLSYSATLFHADYDHLRTQEIAPSGTFLLFASNMEGMTSGAEMWGTWHVSPAWRVSAGLTLLNEKLRLKPGSNDVNAPRTQQGLDPERTWLLSSSFNLTRRTELDVRARHVSELRTIALPAYTAVDVRLGWRARPDLELSIVGQNLFGPGHAEFTPAATRTEFQRAIVFRMLARF